jgi:hypothetical protein
MEFLHNITEWRHNVDMKIKSSIVMLWGHANHDYPASYTTDRSFIF